MKGEIERLLERGIEAAQAGEDERARDLLIHVIELDERNEDAWLWLSFVVDQIADQIVCLENILTINPNDQDAAEDLDRLLREGSIEAREPTLPRLEASEESTSPVCSQCGYRNPGWVYICDRCGADLRPVDLRETLSSGARPRSETPLSLLGAWGGMLIFNRLLAFMPELALASWGRSMAALVLAALLITLYRFGLTVATGEVETIRSLPDPNALLALAATLGSSLTAALVTVGWTALSDLFLAPATWLGAQLMGGQRDFKTHAHLATVMLSGWAVLTAILSPFITLIPRWLGLEARLLAYGGGGLATLIVVMSLFGVVWLKQAIQTAHRLSGTRAAIATALALILALGGLLAYAALSERDLFSIILDYTGLGS